jgi:hypothetical protein
MDSEHVSGDERRYEPPELRELGSVADLTAGGTDFSAVDDRA